MRHYSKLIFAALALVLLVLLTGGIVLWKRKRRAQHP